MITGRLLTTVVAPTLYLGCFRTIQDQLKKVSTLPMPLSRLVFVLFSRAMPLRTSAVLRVIRGTSGVIASG